METTKEVLKRLVKRHGSMYRVEELSGISRGVLRRILIGDIKNPSEKTFMALHKLDRADKKEAENG